MRGRMRITPVLVYATAFAVGCRMFLSGYRLGAYLIVCGSFVLVLGWLLAMDRS
jgi:hypothetical protein